MPGRDAFEKSLERIEHLDGEAFQLFSDIFTEIWKLNDAALDFQKVNMVFLDEFSKNEPQEIITRASEARLDPTNLTKAFVGIEKLYGQARFDDADKLGFLCIAVKDM